MKDHALFLRKIKVKNVVCCNLRVYFCDRVTQPLENGIYSFRKDPRISDDGCLDFTSFSLEFSYIRTMGE